MGDRWDRILADAFMEILRRLPPSPRRRLRLVCRHWRTVIDDLMPRTQARAMVLAFVSGDDGDRPRAYVLDDLTKHGASGRELVLPHGVTAMVGTCNGLLCLRRWRGDFVVVNPVTGEKLAVPPSTLPTEHGKLAAYSFAYHPTTGLYKIVHVSCYGGAVKVFTLGDRSWRVVSPVPVGTSCVKSFGLVSVGGATYWVAADTSSHSVSVGGATYWVTVDSNSHSVMSLDHKDERVVFVAKLPVRIERWEEGSWHLATDLRGKLFVCSYQMKVKEDRTLKGIQTKVYGCVQMWMLKNRGRGLRPAWVVCHKVVEPEHQPFQGVAWPHAAHGQHLLTTRRAKGADRVSLHACRLSRMRKKHGGVVRTEGSPSIGLYDDCDSLRTFAYVETIEPLALYGGNGWDIDESDEWDWRFDDGERRWKLMLHTK